MRLGYYGAEALRNDEVFITADLKPLPIVHIVAGPRVSDIRPLAYLVEQAGY